MNEMNDSERAQLQADKDLFLKIAGSEFGDNFAEQESRTQRDNRTGRIIKSDDGPDDQLIVNFTTEPVLSKKLTYLAGGVPKYVDMEFITIVIPGNKELTFHGPVTPYYQWRFPSDYAAFLAGKGAVLTGTPLALWPMISVSEIKELEYHGIRTIEQVANLSDSANGVLRGFYRMKTKAQEFLDNAKDIAKSGQMQAQMEEQEAKHTAEMAALQKQMAELMEAMTTANTAKTVKAKA
jgi:hypothetical protein